jgi:NADH-quinone oxidoreductase subunit F
MMNRVGSPKELNELKDKMSAALNSGCTRILVCGGTGCMANGAPELLEALQNELDARNIAIRVDMLEDSEQGSVKLGYSGCPGFCQVGPIVRIFPSDYLYTHVQPGDAADIVEQTVMNGKVVDRLLFTDEKTGKSYARRNEIPFYMDQVNIVLADCGAIEPGDIREYIAHDGYRALAESILGI